MRIGMILDKVFPPDPRVAREASRLAEAGHEVYLYCLSEKDRADDEEYKGVALRRYKQSELTYKMSALAYTLPYYSWVMSKSIRRFLIAHKIQAIHLHDMVAGAAVLRANRSLNLPLVLDLHENRPEIMRLYKHVRNFPGKLLISPNKWKRKETELVKRADYTITVTEEAKQELMERTGLSEERICVVPNAVEESFYADQAGKTKSKQSVETKSKQHFDDDFVLLYLGDTGERRGLKTALRALQLLKSDATFVEKTKESLRLVIVGQSSFDRELKNFAQSLGLQDEVSFEGWQEEARFPEYLKVASIGLSPLQRNPHHDTTYANKIFQYMAFGVPVLVSDATAQKRLVQKTESGLIHAADSAEELAAQVKRLYLNREEAKEMGANGKTFVRTEFNWTKQSMALIDLYKQIEP